MCGGTLIGKMRINHADLLGQDIILEKVLDLVLCRHFPIKIKILIISTGPNIKITHLEVPQVEALATATAPAPLDQAVRFVTANQAVNTVPAAQAFRVVPANQNVAVVPASTEAFRVVPATQSVPAIQAVRGGAGHLLADPNTSVYTGFFSNPGAGFGFNF